MTKEERISKAMKEVFKVWEEEIEKQRRKKFQRKIEQILR